MRTHAAYHLSVSQHVVIVIVMATPASNRNGTGVVSSMSRLWWTRRLPHVPLFPLA